MDSFSVAIYIPEISKRATALSFLGCMPHEIIRATNFMDNRNQFRSAMGAWKNLETRQDGSRLKLRAISTIQIEVFWPKIALFSHQRIDVFDPENPQTIEGILLLGSISKES